MATVNMSKYTVVAPRVMPQNDHETQNCHSESPRKLANSQDDVAPPGVIPQRRRLEPYVHQVSGHHCLLNYDATTLCKQLTEREHHFYQTASTQLHGFIPEYRGKATFARKPLITLISTYIIYE